MPLVIFLAAETWDGLLLEPRFSLVISVLSTLLGFLVQEQEEPFLRLNLKF